jgi:hypothetical protein
MARLPALKTQMTDEDRYIEVLVRQMAEGKHPRDIARRVYPNRRQGREGREVNRLRKNLYRRLRSLALRDPRVAQGLVDSARLDLMVGLGPATRALVGRGARGRVDAIKLIYEASGFHNPRVQHEHSGEINIKLDVPRPSYEDTRSEEVTDADVVD